MPRIRLKTKLVLAISGMVFALVAVFSYVYVSHLVRLRTSEALANAGFLAREIREAAGQATHVDPAVLAAEAQADAENESAASVLGHEPSPESAPVPGLTKESMGPAASPHAAETETHNPTSASGKPASPRPSATAIALDPDEALRKDPGLNTLLESIIGYSKPTYDVAITDAAGKAIVHTSADRIGKHIDPREDFRDVVEGNFLRQLEVVYGAPRVYDVVLKLQREGKYFGDIRIGISTVFLKAELRQQLTRAIEFSLLAILVSLGLAAGLSNLALRPLEAIGRRLDQMTADVPDTQPEPDPRRVDEYGLVNTKIDRLGRQMRDVKEVFSALKENLDQIMATLQDGLILFTKDTRVVLVSASAERFVGRAREDILGNVVEKIFTDDRKLGRIVLDAFALQRRIPQREIELENGRRIQIALEFIAERGERIGALLTMRDSESVRRIENEIELSRRLAAIGRLTSGVAHEVKNPINAIVVHLELLREKMRETDPDTRRHMDIIGNEIHRLDRVVQTLVDFNKPIELRLTAIDLRQLVDDVSLLASPEAARQGVKVETHIPEEPLPVNADADLIKHALLNVVLNGVQAMSNGGVLTIQAFKDEASARVEVQDQGTGIPADIRDKVFNLYFTTKKSGSGIGLAMSYRVLQLHNGSLDFETEMGRGTTFRLCLPLAGAKEPQSEEALARS